MSEIVGRLCREHRNIGALLDMLERMLDGLESASDPSGDIGLMRDIMTYMIRFPDHTHHPMEDLMFERMRARGLAPQTERSTRSGSSGANTTVSRGRVKRCIWRCSGLRTERGPSVRRWSRWAVTTWSFFDCTHGSKNGRSSSKPSRCSVTRTGRRSSRLSRKGSIPYSVRAWTANSERSTSTSRTPPT